MTAYTMNVVVVNETDADVRWVGASTLSSLDGETSVGPLSVEANSHGKTVISKRGGKQGLFTALTWGVGSADPRFSVYVRMPAAIDDITASLRDVFGMDVHQFENSSAADYCEANTFHGNPNNKDSPKRTSVLVDSFVYHGYNFKLDRLQVAYPNSTCRVTITKRQSLTPAVESWFSKLAQMCGQCEV